MSALILVALAWGASAFGAVYPWGWVPLAITLAAAGLAGFVRRPPGIALRTSPALAGAVAAVACSIALQVVPLPRALVSAASPGTGVLLQRWHADGAQRSTAADRAGAQPISMDAGATAVSLVLFAAFGLALVGAARGFTARDVRVMVRGLTVLGAVVSIMALFQRLSSTDGIYGFWLPAGKDLTLHGGGPFINRNHLAGWLLLVLPVTLASIPAQVAVVSEDAPTGWRERILWLASPAAMQTVLTALAALTMATALVQTLSRSGLAGFLVGTAITGAVVMRSRWPAVRRWSLTLVVASIAALAVVLVGLPAIEARMDESGVSFTDRRLAWEHTLRIIRDVPVVGTGLGTYADAMVVYHGADPRVRFEEAHNDYLQLLAEGGLLVVVPAALLIAVFAREVRNRFRDDTHTPIVYWARVGAVTGLVAIAFQETVEFSLQMPGNFALLVVLMAMAAGRLPHREGFQLIRP